VDFALLVKLYGDFGQHGQERYSPGRITEVISKVRDGRPDPAHHLHQPRREAEPHAPDANPEAYSFDERLFKEAGQLESCIGIAFCLFTTFVAFIRPYESRLQWKPE
jgi:hypothetical protein